MVSPIDIAFAILKDDWEPAEAAQNWQFGPDGEPLTVEQIDQQNQAEINRLSDKHPTSGLPRWPDTNKWTAKDERESAEEERVREENMLNLIRWKQEELRQARSYQS